MAYKKDKPFHSMNINFDGGFI